MNNSVPASVLRLLWDVRRDTVDIYRNRNFIIRRVLDYGDAEAVRWLRHTYPEAAIKEVIQAGKGMAHKTISFWRQYYNLNSEEKGV